MVDITFQKNGGYCKTAIIYDDYYKFTGANAQQPPMQNMNAENICKLLDLVNERGLMGTGYTVADLDFTAFK